MKKTILFFFALFLFHLAFAQEEAFTPKVTLKWAPTGLPAGNIGLQGEYSLSSKNALTAKIGIPVAAHHTLQYEDKDANFDLKAFSFLAGYRTYLSKKDLRGLYVEPFFKYVNHQSKGIGNGSLNEEVVTMNFTNHYSAAGIGAQLGAQFFIGKRFVIDLFFLGPEINIAHNTLKAAESTHTIPWSSVEASEAEADIRAFIDQFPIIRNRTEISVAREQRTVTADFKGALPGVRAGVSFGIAF